MKKSEVEFVETLREVGLSKSICESVNNIRKVIFEESSPEESLSFEEKVEKYNETHDRSLFDDVDDSCFDEDGCTEVVLDGKYNFIDKDGNLLWKGEKWFDDVGFFRDGYIGVELDGKHNFIDKDGDLLWKEEKWFDDAWEFDEGYAVVALDGKLYRIDTEGDLHY